MTTESDSGAEVIRTTCTLDCQDACGVDVHVKDGHVVGLRGAKDHPYTEGFLCIRLNRYMDRLYSSERMTEPLRKTKSGWQAIGWDDALDLAAEKIGAAVEQHGSTSILYYMDVGSFGVSKQFNVRLFNRLGGPTMASGSLCLGAGIAGTLQTLGKCAGSEPADMLNSEMIVLWGRNPAAYSVHMMPLIKRAQARGIKIVLIDPIRNETARFCDRHYAPKPGGDGYLALGICKYLFETGTADQDFLKAKTANPEVIERMTARFSWDELAAGAGLPLESLRELAQLFVDHRPASVFMGKGPQHYVQGAEITRLIVSVCAVAGNIGVSGGGYQFNSEYRSLFDGSLNGDGFVTQRRTAPKGRLGEAILTMGEPPLRVAYINGGNPVTQCPNSTKVAKALSAIDFVVVVDPFMTDTADCADLYLPCAMFLEERDVRAASWNPYVGPVIPAVAPQGGVKSDWEILGLLAERLGIDDPYLGKPVETLLQAALAPMGQHGLDPVKAMSQVFRKPNATEVAFADGEFGTPSGKLEFLDDWEPVDRNPAADKAGKAPANMFPLQLLSLKHPRFQASQALQSLQDAMEPTAWLHPETAARFGVGEKAAGRLESAYGSYPVVFGLDDGIRRDVCVARAGGWLKQNRGINVLTSDVLSTSGETPGYYETRVRVVTAD